MPDIKDMQGLDKYIQLTLTQALNIVADETIVFLKNYIEKHWYEYIPESSYYTSVYALLRSAMKSKVKKVGKEYQIEVFLDPDKLPSDYRGMDKGSGEFNARMSYDGSTNWKGMPLSEAIVLFIEEGFHIPFAIPNEPTSFKGGYYDGSDGKYYEGIHMIEQTRNWLRIELVDILNKAFRKAGFELQVM